MSYTYMEVLWQAEGVAQLHEKSSSLLYNAADVQDCESVNVIDGHSRSYGQYTIVKI